MRIASQDTKSKSARRRPGLGVHLRMMFPMILVFMLVTSPAAVQAETPQAVPKSDRVVVKKSQRELLLLKSSRVIYVFPIALGDEPEGDKLEEGDWRTPEGRYIIDWRNPDSRFYKSLHISYPNVQDRQESASAGVDPGGMIMIHGHPMGAGDRSEKYIGRDWTDGCIALKNEDMDIVWSSVDDGTPIDIFP